MTRPIKQPSAETVNEFLDANIVPLLNKYGATEVSRDTIAHLNVKEFSTFTIIVLEKNAQRFEMGMKIEHPHRLDRLEFLLKHWDRVEKVRQSLDGIEAPSHSDVNRAFKTEFGGRMMTNDCLAYLYVCDRIRKDGRA